MLLACSSPPVAPAPAPAPRYAATSHPARWLLEQLLPEGTPVSLVGDGSERSSPGPEQILGADGAILVISGVGWEGWLVSASVDPARTLDLGQGLDLIPLEASHDHGGGEHEHRGADPLVWGDPSIVRAQAARLARELDSIDPARALALDNALADYEVGLLAACGDPRVQAAHPFAYLARFCGWESALPLRLEVTEPGNKPSLEGDHPRIVLDPLEAPSADADYDYLASGRRNIDVLLSSLAD